MNFDKQKIAAMVKSMAARMLPGWSYELIFANSTDEIGGALGMIEPVPQRKQFKMWIAPHPDGEFYEETIAHELTHGILSPLTHLLPPSGSVVMIEEMIVEPLGCELAKIMCDLPQYARAVLRALHSPRTKSAALRQRISAIATRQRFAERKHRMDPKMIEEIIAAIKEGNGDAAIELLTKLLANAAGSGNGEGGGENGDAATRENEENGAYGGGDMTAMREEDMPPMMRGYVRSMRRAAVASLDSLVRMRLHEGRTVDRLDITPAMEARLRKARSAEEFEERYELLRLGLQGSSARARSGVDAGDVGGTNGAPSRQRLLADGIDPSMVEHVLREYAKSPDHGKVALETAMKFRKQVPNG